MNSEGEGQALPHCAMEVSVHIDKNGRRTKYILSKHSDGFSCLQILTEEDLLSQEKHEAQSRISSES